MEQDNPNPPEPGISLGHEERDARPRPMAVFAIVFLVSIIAIHAIGWGVFIWIRHQQQASNLVDHPEHPLSRLMQSMPPGARLEPEPSHDVLPVEDLDAVRAREEALIGVSAWSWIDSGHRFARIPLSEATELAVAGGLPNILPATQPSTQPGLPPASAVHGPGGLP